MIRIIPLTTPKTIALRVSGNMLRPFSEEMLAELCKKSTEDQRENIYIEARTFDDISVQALVRYLRFRLPESMRHGKKAIVAKPRTVDKWQRSRHVQETFPTTEVRLFTEQQRVEALQWTKA